MVSPRPVRLQIPASTSNVGPGFDAFSIALDMAIEVRWEAAEADSLERTGGLAESPLSRVQDPLTRGMRRAARLAGKELPTGKVTVSASFPPGRGLGASGSGLVAGLMLGNRLTGGKLEDKDLLDEAIQMEGNPENAVGAMLGGAHWSIRLESGRWRHVPVQLHNRLRFLLVVPPYPLDTRRSREALPSSVAVGRAIRQAQRTPVLLEGLRELDPELIRVGVQDELHVAPRLRLMAGGQAMVDFAMEAGALGATLSGAGSALLVLTRTGEMRDLEARLRKRVDRLWGADGTVLSARVQPKGASFLR